ncbi:MAG TPA: ABC transporter ATP-binding protein [Phycisphaerales bacterium]|nr:ABC transporter ATP-binding protein [Phycisphaerales bacterium]
MSIPALSVKGARRAFDSTRALDDVSLDIATSQRVALLGPNGAGKTTLIRSIAGLTKLDAGAIELAGVPATSLTRRQLGLVPQDLAVHDRMTASENLHFFGRLHMVGGKTLRQRVKWALDWTALTERRDDLAATFSGGMKRRLNIACGILHEPNLVLLDEPTVGVDPQSRERIHGMLAALHEHGTSWIITTHMMDEAARNVDRIIVIDHGRIIADGTLDSLIADQFGEHRVIRVTVDSIPASPPTSWRITSGSVGSPGGLERDLISLDAATSTLDELKDGGIRVTGLEVYAPTLQDVFLNLTGRELRE